MLGREGSSAEVRLGAVQGRSACVSQLETGSRWEMKALQQHSQKSSLLQLFASPRAKQLQKPCDLSLQKSSGMSRLRPFLSQKLCLNCALLLVPSHSWERTVTLLPALSVCSRR